MKLLKITKGNEYNVQGRRAYKYFSYATNIIPKKEAYLRPVDAVDTH